MALNPYFNLNLNPAAWLAGLGTEVQILTGQLPPGSGVGINGQPINLSTGQDLFAGGPGQVGGVSGAGIIAPMIGTAAPIVATGGVIVQTPGGGQTTLNGVVGQQEFQQYKAQVANSIAKINNLLNWIIEQTGLELPEVPGNVQQVQIVDGSGGGSSSSMMMMMVMLLLISPGILGGTTTGTTGIGGLSTTTLLLLMMMMMGGTSGGGGSSLFGGGGGSSSSMMMMMVMLLLISPGILGGTTTGTTGIGGLSTTTLLLLMMMMGGGF